MGEAMGSGFARLLSCEPALGVEGLGPWVCGGDIAPFVRLLPCGAGPERCAAYEGPATQGPNRRLGLFVRHRNQQGKRSLRSGWVRTETKSTGRGLMCSWVFGSVVFGGDCGMARSRSRPSIRCCLLEWMFVGLVPSLALRGRHAVWVVDSFVLWRLRFGWALTERSLSA